jgi:hypothetical protein
MQHEISREVRERIAAISSAEQNMTVSVTPP